MFLSQSTLYVHPQQLMRLFEEEEVCIDISMHSVYRHKFVRLFVICRHGSSLLWTPALRPYSGPVHLPRERKGIGRCNHNHNNHNNKVQFSALSTAKNRADKALQEYTCINKKIQTLKH